MTAPTAAAKGPRRDRGIGSSTVMENLLCYPYPAHNGTPAVQLDLAGCSAMSHQLTDRWHATGPLLRSGTMPQ